MNPSSKVVGFFAKQFWPKDMRSVICSESPFPELWPVSPTESPESPDFPSDFFDADFSEEYDSGADSDDSDDFRGIFGHSEDPAVQATEDSRILPGPCSVTGSGIGGTIGKQITDSSATSDGVGRTVTTSHKGNNLGDGSHIFVGFCCANYARNINRKNMRELREIFCQQLDGIFGTLEDPHPATENCRDVLICRWGRKKFIRGGYSSPARKPENLPEHHLVLLRRTLGNQIYFAGEAVMDGHSTMDAAADAGMAAAREVLRNISGNIPNLLRTVPAKL